MLIDFAINLSKNIGIQIAEQDLQLSFSKIYKQYTSYLTNLHQLNSSLFGFNLNLFQSDFFESCKLVSQDPKNFQSFLQNLLSIFMIFLVKTIFRLISIRFNNNHNFSFEEIENLEHIILRTGASFLVTTSLTIQNFLKQTSNRSSDFDHSLLYEQLEDQFTLSSSYFSATKSIDNWNRGQKVIVLSKDGKNIGTVRLVKL